MKQRKQQSAADSHGRSQISTASWKPGFYNKGNVQNDPFQKVDVSALDRWIKTQSWVDESDPEATVHWSVGLVIVVSAAARTYDPEIVSNRSGLPMGFVEPVLRCVEKHTLTTAQNWGELSILVRSADANVKELDDFLLSLVEGFWNEQADRSLRNHLILDIFGPRIFVAIEMVHLDLYKGLF